MCYFKARRTFLQDVDLYYILKSFRSVNIKVGYELVWTQLCLLVMVPETAGANEG